MAGQEKVNLNSNCSDLYGLIHAIEYENQQYVKMIEKENQRIQYLESQEEEKLAAVTELQTSITNLELETKSNHKQLVHNKTTLESQRKTKVVLQAHADALVKQLDTLRDEISEQQREYEDSLQHYEKIWMDYEVQYKSLPLYKTLLEAEAKLAESESEKSKVQQQKKELQCRVQAAQAELDMRDWRRFCVKIEIRAKKKLCTEKKKTDLLDAEGEIENLQSKLKEIHEKNNSSNNTLLETSQGMETDEILADTYSDKVTSQREDITGLDNTLTEVGREMSIDSVTVTQKENVTSECSKGSEPETTNPLNNTLTQERTFSQTNGPTKDSTQDKPVNVTEEFRFPSRFQLQNISTPAEPGSREHPSWRERSQLPTTPRIPQLSTAFAVPKISHGQPPHTSIKPPRQNNVKPRPMPIPLITVPRLSGPKSASSSKDPTVQSSLSKVPTVRSALSSILSGTKPAPKSCQKPAPVMVKNPMPRTPLIAPPPSPVLSSIPCQQPELKQTYLEATKITPLSVSVPILPTLAISTSNVSERVVIQPPNVPVSSSVSQLPQLLRPLSIKPTPSCKVNIGSKPSLVTPVNTSSGAGDAALLHSADMAKSLKTNDGGDGVYGVHAANPVEEMESDAENRGSEMSTPDGILFISPGSCSGEQLPAYSPFDIQKHMERLNAIKQTDDDFNPFQQQPTKSNNQQPHLKYSCDETTAAKTRNNTKMTSTSSMFFMDFTSTEPVAQPMAPLFSKPGAPSTSESGIKPTSPNRQERSGSFFSFESMETSETPGGNTLLSMFGHSDKEAGSEMSFFRMNSNHGDNNKDSGFAFSFGDGDGGESTSGSVFSLF